MTKVFRVALVVLLLTMSANIGTFVQPGRVAGATYLTRTAQFTVYTLSVPLLWSIKQTAKVTGFWETTGNKLRHHLRVEWTSCSATSIGIVIEKTWCGWLKPNATTVQFGMNFTKKPYDVIGSQDCWARKAVQMALYYQSTGAWLIGDPTESGCD